MSGRHPIHTGNILHIWRKNFNTFLATGVFCHLLINFANSLDPDQDRQKIILYCIYDTIFFNTYLAWERSGSVVEC